MNRSDFHQLLLIGSGILVSTLFGVFLYREIFPEYKIYQEDSIALEKFRETYTHQNPPDFKTGIKQIVLEREDKGPAVIDRCTSCHVALQIPYFSPTRLSYDDQGKIVTDELGIPVQVPNEEYIWTKLNKEILDLREQNDSQADRYEALKTANIDGHVYDVSKVLRMHPLMGKETRPFEFHPIEEYGCTVCHNGNGRGLTTEKAHGPVFDGHYEKEFTGPKPKFLEEDPLHDPRFSKVFNGKPGHSLLFQTQPLFVGGLIQAKCMQCHQNTHSRFTESAVSASKNSDFKLNSIDLLTSNYRRGEELYISQACYACHRIAGIARGGVGPELTNIGSSYPWYIKESIVWPQADVKNSTMPNMELDHNEIEDLMAFLLAQLGRTKAQSEIQYKTSIQEWEAGRKLPWEKPLTSTQIYDLNFSKTVFATEGCAACHRLQGFESNIGFKVEKENTSTELLQKEQEWFMGIFPELVSGGAYDREMSGSEIAQQIQLHQEEIDRRIVDNVRQNSILEEIDTQYPQVIESFYSNFSFAARLFEDSLWKSRVHRVLFTYIQVYGLGRLIGPKPSWSGLYRSDEWLMEHFRNPSSHIPRSIMPVMPFDDTRFYALTNLLDHLSVLNRNSARKTWEAQGFDPSKVYTTHCAQCHGLSRQGNGPVSEWIYPIPKNLQNNEFLLNLTKKEAVHSIVHGVIGTPMAPWGEVAKDKPESIAKLQDNQPVLTEVEIQLLVDWLYSGLSGLERIKGSEDVLKWQYEAEDVIKELHKEGGKLEQDHETPLSSLISKMHFSYASLIPLQPKVISEYSPDDLFDIVQDPNTNEKRYYIKERYYTKKNIDAGQALYQLNCASCHGSEGDGSGVRAQAMKDAKPRMLTNLDWINTRDDLRLLRSIKFGVPGTSMTPWGDATSTLQRLQLVIFIRSLTEDREKNERLNHLLYQTYDQAIFRIDEARLVIQRQIDELNHTLLKETDSQVNLEKAVIQDGLEKDKVLELYQSRLLNTQKVVYLNSQNEQFLELKKEIRVERNLYQNLGIELITKINDPKVLDLFLEIIKNNQERYLLSDSVLTWNQNKSSLEAIKKLEAEIIDLLDKKIAAKEKQKAVVESTFNNSERKTHIEEISNQIATLIKLKSRFESDISEALQLIQNQQKILEQARIL